MINTGQFLSQKQSLQQRLSPQQIQYIKLLQLPTLALEQRIKEELEANPALEEGGNDTEPEPQDDTLRDPVGEEDERGEADDDVAATDEHDEIDWEEILHDQPEDEYRSGSFRAEDEEWRDLPKPYHESLLESLENQVSLLDLNEREELIADQILGSIEEDGYFRREITSIVDGIAFNQGILVTDEEVESVLQVIQRLEPVGIAARDLRECLLIQLEMLPEQTLGRSDAIKIVKNEWKAFEKKHFDRLLKKLNIDEEELRDAFECIQGLDPKPGAVSEESGAAEYIIPDFEVQWEPKIDSSGREIEGEGEFEISLNGRNLPPLRISPQYKVMWDDSKKKETKTASQKETQQFIKSKIESAKWFLDSIRQRQNTLLSVMRTIVALQEDFFKYGDNLKPMILKDVADRINMDISTISRVVNGKYVQTNFGVHELKYFFNEGLTTESGEEVSNREVKNILSEIIDKEDKKNPLSDLALVEALKEKGYKIARRTVSKYREQLNIPVARLRKSIF